MAADEKWYFTKEQLQNTPSRRCDFDADKELSYRQQAANFIQDMGQKLQVSQLCINTAIVYMHRFYMFHSFTHFPWNTIAAASFFLAAKVEEQPRKLEHVIRIANHCLHRDQSVIFDAKSEQYAAQSQDLVFNENVLLQTLGFDVAIDHPHTHVVRCCHLVRASKDLAQTSYFMASNSLHLTTMCLQYKPTVVACFCIHLTSKWSNWQIPKSIEGKDWYYYVDKTVTAELLEQLTTEFLKIFDKCPSRLKRKISSISNINQHQTIDQIHSASTSSNSPFDPDSRRYHMGDGKESTSGSTFHRSHHENAKLGLLATPDEAHKKPQRPHDPSASSSHQQRVDYRAKEKERLEREKAAGQHHSKSGSVIPIPGGKHMPPAGPPSTKPHHRLPPGGANVDPQQKMKMHHRPSESLGHREHQYRDKNMGMREMNGRENREHHKERDHQKMAEYLAFQQQQNSQMGHNSHSANELNKVDPLRQKPVDTKLPPPKPHDQQRHRRELDPKYAKGAPPGSTHPAPNQPPNLPSNASSSVVKPPSAVASSAEKNLFSKPITNSTSQRHKSPFDAQKSVPQVAKTDIRNGGASSNILDAPSIQQSQLPPWQPEPQPVNNILQQPSLSSSLDEPADMFSIPPPSKKISSLFSPEKTPPQSSNSKKPWDDRPSSPNSTKTQVTPSTSIAPPISPFGSPPPMQPHPKLQTPTSLRRSRTSSSGSEPELRPVVKKLDQISGFENIIRDSKMGIKLAKVPDIIQPICDRPTLTEPSISKELKPPEIIKPFNTSATDSALSVNGIDSDPSVISTLLKESVAPNHLITTTPALEVDLVAKTAEVMTSSVQAPVSLSIPNATDSSIEKHKTEHHHKSEKKKKKDKHKHKDKDKSRDEKKKKHKDKDKERHKKSDKLDQQDSSTATTSETTITINTPLKITIPKNKLEPVLDQQPPPSIGLKVKISRDKIKPDSITTEPLPPPPMPASNLKIKISKDQMHQYNSVDVSTNNGSSSRKRDRDKTPAAAPLPTVPPTKILKSSYGGRESRQNGRNNSFAKVSYHQNSGRFNMVPPPRMPPPGYPLPHPQNVPPQYYVQNYLHPPQPGYMYPTPDQLFQFYAAQSYPMFAPPDMFMQPPPMTTPSNNNPFPPPLPDGPPPDAPPPPPPEP